MRKYILAVSASILLLPAQSWKDKKTSDWNEEDAKEILTDSPWAIPVEPQISAPKDRGPRRGGIMIGGPMGIPVGGRRGGRPNGRDEREDSRPTSARLTLRWESALPVQEAAMKARITDEPSVEEGSYAVAVVGLPARMVDRQNRSKLKAELKCDGCKPAIKSTGTQILSRDDGTTVLFLFPRSREIGKDEREITFETEIGSMSIRESFNLLTMVLNGKREL
jgi:hypothetical protein